MALAHPILPCAISLAHGRGREELAVWRLNRAPMIATPRSAASPLHLLLRLDSGPTTAGPPPTSPAAWVPTAECAAWVGVTPQGLVCMALEACAPPSGAAVTFAGSHSTGMEGPNSPASRELFVARHCATLAPAHSLPGTVRHLYVHPQTRSQGSHSSPTETFLVVAQLDVDGEGSASESTSQQWCAWTLTCYPSATASSGDTRRAVLGLSVACDAGDITSEQAFGPVALGLPSGVCVTSMVCLNPPLAAVVHESFAHDAPSVALLAVACSDGIMRTWACSSDGAREVPSLTLPSAKRVPKVSKRRWRRIL